MSEFASDDACFQQLPWSVILGFVQDDPILLLACMMVSKSLPKAAGRLMNLNSSDMKHCCFSTLGQQVAFERFLGDPSVFAKAWEEKKNGHDSTLIGPVRAQSIRSLSDSLAKAFVILQYEGSYSQEASSVAVIDPDTGNLVAIYMQTSKQFYEDHCSCTSFHDFMYGMCGSGAKAMTITNSGSLNEPLAVRHYLGVDDDGIGISKAENAWIMKRTTWKRRCSDLEEWYLNQVAAKKLRGNPSFSGEALSS